MSSFHTAVFDLDGTLLNTLQDLADSVNYALAIHHFPPRSVDDVRRFVGDGVAALISRAVPEGTSPELEGQVLASFRAHYYNNMDNKTAPYSGIPQLLQTLIDRGLRLAVVSNKFDSAVKGLCQNYFPGLISVAIGESPGVAKKPAPDTVRRALEELGSPLEGAVYIGDSDVDIATARNARIPCISVSWGFRDAAFLADHGAGRIVGSPAQLLDALLA